TVRPAGPCGNEYIRQCPDFRERSPSMRILALFMIAVVSLLQNQSGTIQGHVVRLGTNIGIPDALVYMSRPGANTVTVMTDNAGNFTIRDVPAGKHVVYASLEGHFGPSRGAIENNVHTSVTVMAGDTASVSFTLIPGDA